MQKTQNISSSSVSDTSQIRYQKAVKQISKLISMNNTVKKDTQKLKNICQQLQIQNKQLMENYDESIKQKNQLNKIIKEYQQKIHLLQQNLANLYQQPLITQNIIEEQRKKYQQQINNCHLKLNQQGSTMSHHQQFIGELQQQNKELKKQLEYYIKKQQQEQKIKKNNINANSCKKCQQNFKKIQNNFIWKQKIQQQNIFLRKKIISLESVGGNCWRYDRGNRDYKQYLIESLEEKVRILQQSNKRRRIQNERKDRKLQKLQNEKAKIQQPIIEDHK